MTPDEYRKIISTAIDREVEAYTFTKRSQVDAVEEYPIKKCLGWSGIPGPMRTPGRTGGDLQSLLSWPFFRLVYAKYPIPIRIATRMVM